MSDIRATASPLRPNRARRRARVSLTPLVDVVFILLVFFMLASSFRDWRSLRVAAAPAGGEPAQSAVGAMLVEVRPEGLRLSGEPVAPGALTDRLAERRERRPDLRVLVLPAEGVALQAAVDALDRIEAAGVVSVTLVAGPGR